MTDAGSSQPTPPLGVGSLISESFSILLSRFFQVITIGFVPGIIGVLISGMLVGYEETTGLAEPQFTDAGDLLAHGVSFIVNMVIYSITTALLVQLAYDTKLQRPVQIGRYFGPALSAVIPLAILSIVATTLAAIAAMAFIVPGLWVAAVFSVLAPAIVIERVGFGGLSRSAALTKEFRWPIVGAMLLMIACAIVINIDCRLFHRVARGARRNRGRRHSVHRAHDNRDRTLQHSDCLDLRPSARNQGRHRRGSDRRRFRLIGLLPAI